MLLENPFQAGENVDLFVFIFSSPRLKLNVIVKYDIVLYGMAGYCLGVSKRWLKFSPGSGTLDKSLDFECVLGELQTLKALCI